MDNYWNRKVELTARAKSHTKLMEDKYKDEIEMAINNINANMALILIGNNNAYITYPYKAKT